MLRFLPPALDALTGLRSPWWRPLHRPLGDRGPRAFRPERGLAWLASRPTDTVFFAVDIVELRRVNDHYGYPYGNEAIIAVARRLQAAAGPRPTYRAGSDLFVVVARMPDAASADAFEAALRATVDQRPLAVPLLSTEQGERWEQIQLTVRTAQVRFDGDGFDAVGRQLDAFDDHRDVL